MMKITKEWRGSAQSSYTLRPAHTREANRQCLGKLKRVEADVAAVDAVAEIYRDKQNDQIMVFVNAPDE